MHKLSEKSREIVALALLGFAMFGVLSTLAQGCVVQGYRTAKASAVAPAEYSRLVLATGFAVIFFGEAPDLLTVVGALLITGAAIVSATRGEPERLAPVE